MRSIAAAIRKIAVCEVTELSPNEIPDLNEHQLVFIDYFLEGGKECGAREEQIAKDIEAARNPAGPHQIVLMSSTEGVRSLRKIFRETAGLEGAAFSFVAKTDFDEPWKVRAHLKMFARALPHSRLIADYVTSAKKVCLMHKHMWPIF